MIPTLIVAGLPAAVRDDYDLNAGRAYGAVQPAKVVEQADLIGDRLDTRIDLAALGQEIVLGIDEEQGVSLARVSGLGHCRLLGPPCGRLYRFTRAAFGRSARA
jgi:hypothetical protein